MDTTDARLLLQAAVEEAQAGVAEGGLPIGSVNRDNETSRRFVVSSNIQVCAGGPGGQHRGPGSQHAGAGRGPHRPRRDGRHQVGR